MNTDGRGHFLFRRVIAAVMAGIVAGFASAQAPPDVIVPVFDEAVIEYDSSLADGSTRDELRVYKEGRVIETTVNLPPPPANQRDAQRILATLIVDPVIVQEGGKIRPGDPWTRLGSLTLVQKSSDQTPVELELMRFITGFGGQGTFTQDLTALAPLLQGETTIRLFISTYKKPAWKVTLTFSYTTEGAGYRRPVWSVPLFNDDSVTSEENRLQASIEVPAGLARPRLRLISTGHASDGTGGDEFVTRTHVLRIDGKEVARWRPWTENAGELRRANPMSGRMLIDGRELWSSDLDRSGWRCGEVVQPLFMPVAELAPGTHTIEVEILGIRSKDQFGNHGYWRVSAIAVADEPWPEHAQPEQE